MPTQASIKNGEMKDPHKKLYEELQNPNLNSSFDIFIGNKNDLGYHIQNDEKTLERLNSFQKDKNNIDDKDEIYAAENESEKPMINSDLTQDENISNKEDLDINFDKYANSQRNYCRKVMSKSTSSYKYWCFQILTDSIN